MPRNYKEEYRKFHSSPKAKNKRAKLNKINRDKGTYGNGDGKDVSHMSDGSIVLESPSKNRGNKTRTPGDRNARGSYLKKRNVRKAQDGMINDEDKSNINERDRERDMEQTVAKSMYGKPLIANELFYRDSVPSGKVDVEGETYIDPRTGKRGEYEGGRQHYTPQGVEGIDLALEESENAFLQMLINKENQSVDQKNYDYFNELAESIGYDNYGEQIGGDVTDYLDRVEAYRDDKPYVESLKNLMVEELKDLGHDEEVARKSAERRFTYSNVNDELIQGISQALERVDTLSDEDYNGFINLISKYASNFGKDNTISQNIAEFIKLDASDFKKYREKMGLSKRQVLDLIQPPAGATRGERAALEALKKATLLKKFEEGGKVPSGKRSKSIQDAINWVVDKDATEEKDKLRVLMEATAFLENSFGANEDAYNRDYTNSHWSIDDGFLSDLVTKRSPRYDKVYNDYFNKYEAISSDRSNLESLLESNDEIASALSARIKYAISPEPLPDTDIDSVVDYWYRNYNSNPNFTEEDIERKKNEYRKFLESRSSNDTIGREFSTGGLLNYEDGGKTQKPLIKEDRGFTLPKELVEDDSETYKRGDTMYEELYKLENTIDNLLDKPMDKASETARSIADVQTKGRPGDFDKEDALRHTLSGLYTGEKVGPLATNILGIAHEVINKNKPKEHFQDIMNNLIGSLVSMAPASVQKKEDWISWLSDNNLLFEMPTENKQTELNPGRKLKF